MTKQISKRGAVSIFLVVFTALLMMIISIGFIRLMLAEQQRSLASDLADSAYDSAMAGVADAKRALIKYAKEICASPDKAKCDSLLAKLDGSHCGVVQSIFGEGDENKEVPIATSAYGSGDKKDSLEQAYTCVKIKYFTDSYERDLKNDQSEHVMVPLDVNGQANGINLHWHSAADSDGINYDALEETSEDRTMKWPTIAEWDKKPPVLMVQYIDAANPEDTRIVFLKPIKSNSSLIREIDLMSPDVDNPTPVSGKNVPAFNIGCAGNKAYGCEVKLKFNIAPNDRNKFLKITKLYNSNTSVRLDFKDMTSDGKLVRFNGIQPEIDSTGRANQIFRRVKARVEFTNGLFPYPEATVKTSHGDEGDLCKSFEITNNRLKGNRSFSGEEKDCLID